MNCKACGAEAPAGTDRCPDCGRRLVTAVLEVLDGDAVTETHDLAPRELSLGRALENDIVLADGSVSRRHARIVFEAGRFRIEDVGSSLGLVVNGNKVTESWLTTGDTLALGDARLRFRDDPDADPAPDEDPAGYGELLLSVLEPINSSLSLHEVCGHVVEAVMHITGAERGFLLLAEETAETLAAGAESVAGMRMLASRTAPTAGKAVPKGPALSSSIVRQACIAGKTVATGNALADPTLQPSNSVAKLEMRTIVCIPLKTRPHKADDPSYPIGALYVDNHALSPPFRQESLRAAEALARHAALAIEHAMLFEREQLTIAELKEARDKAFEASRVKSLFLANMSHELHTPLNAIIGYADMLREKAAELGQPEMLPDLKKIRTAGKHLLQLIDDVLDVSQLEQGSLRLAIAEFELGPLVANVVKRAHPLLHANGNEVELRAADDLGSMTSDSKRLRQVLFALIANAAKFTEHGHVKVDVERKADNPARLTFRVSDTGIGMTPDQVERAFDAFTQGDDSETRRHGGLGLGLSISRQLARKMGGDLWVRSEPGKGSTFTLELPEQAPEQPVETSDE